MHTSALRAQPKRRVLVGDQDERVGNDPVVPADDALHEIKHSPRVVPGEQDGEPGDYHHHNHRDVQEREHDVVSNLGNHEALVKQRTQPRKRTPPRMCPAFTLAVSGTQ
jgi:hypothetical protein